MSIRLAVSTPQHDPADPSFPIPSPVYLFSTLFFHSLAQSLSLLLSSDRVGRPCKQKKVEEPVEEEMESEVSSINETKGTLFQLCVSVMHCIVLHDLYCMYVRVYVCVYESLLNQLVESLGIYISTMVK